MKQITFAFLTLVLCCLCLSTTPLVVAFGLMSSLFSFVKCRELHLFFHRVTQSVLDVIMSAFDYADAVMGFVKHPGLATDQDKQEYSVSYFTSDWRHLHNAVVSSHCIKCAEIDGYHSYASDYAFVVVERTV